MADESYPQDLKYFREHDWVRVEGDEATFGITWWAQDALGDMVYASLPDAGATVAVGAALRRARVGQVGGRDLRPGGRRGGGRQRRPAAPTPRW